MAGAFRKAAELGLISRVVVAEELDQAVDAELKLALAGMTLQVDASGRLFTSAARSL